MILEYYPLQGASRTVPMHVLPFRIGRGGGADFVLPSSQVSKEHAEIFQVGPEFRLRDLGSTNGTFLNNQRVSEVALRHDDIFHLAHEEFRFLTHSHPDLVSPHTQPLMGAIPDSLARGTQFLDEMIRERIVRVLFQPIVQMATREVVGFEALGRGMHESLSAKPYELFQLASRCNKATSLSELFRKVAVEECPKLPRGPLLFLNIHPTEIHQANFLHHLAEIREWMPPNRQMVLEIHEDVACELPTMKELRQALRDMDVMIAYDDFGAGQARFLELAELPPDFVKLDMKLVRNIQNAAPRRNLMKALTRVSLDLGIRVIAEGIETAGEAEVCLEMGCQYAQGFYYGLPKMASAYTAKEQTNVLNVADLRARLRDADRVIPQASNS